MKRKQGDEAKEQITSQTEQIQLSQLVDAAEKGDLPKIIELLDAGAPVDAPHLKSRWTPILYALHGKHVEAVRTLFQRGARIDKLIGTRKRSFLHIAAELDIHELVAYFLINGVSPDVFDSTGWLPIHYAALNSSCASITEFHKASINLNAVTMDGETALHIAARLSNEAMVTHLLALGLDPHAKDALGAKPIHHAAKAGSLAVLNVFLKVMGESAVQEKDLKGRTVSHWATAQGHCHIVTRILKTKNFFFAVDSNRRSLMHDAAASGSVKMIETLNVNHLPYDLKDSQGRLPIHDAAIAGQVKVMDHFVKHGGLRYDCADNAGAQPIHLATEANREECVLHLKENGVSLFTEDAEGKIPLHYAAFSGHQTLFDTLLSLSGGVAKHLDKKGRNCLFHAARGDQGDFILHLKSYVNAIDFKSLCKLGLTAMHHAAFKGAKHAIKALIACGLSINEADKKGLQPIHIASRSGDCDTFDFLVDNGANINAINLAGLNAICFAAEQGQEAMLRHLVARGVQYHNVVTTTGLTPLHIAAGFGSLPCVKYFVEELGIDPCATTADDKKITVRDYALMKNKKEVADYLKKKSPKKAVAFRGQSSLETFFYVPSRESPEKKREREEEAEVNISDVGSVLKK